MRILFITSTRIGDAIQSTGILAALTARYPDARVTVAAGPLSAPLFAALPALERLLVVRKRPYAGHWWRLWLETVATSWDLIVDLRASKFAWTVRRSESLTVTSKREHEPRVLELARLIGAESDPPAPTVWLTEEHERRAAGLIPDEPKVLAIGPTANWIGKTWMPERFAELVRRLTRPGAAFDGARLAVFGGPGEEDKAKDVLAALPADRVIDLVGRADLLLAAACLRRCALFIGNDSGLMHLSAASGVPTLGLFGPSSERRYGPWGDHCAYVRTPESLEEIVSQPGYNQRLPKSWMTNLEVEAVEAAALNLLARTGAGSSG